MGHSVAISLEREWGEREREKENKTICEGTLEFLSLFLSVELCSSRQPSL